MGYGMSLDKFTRMLLGAALGCAVACGSAFAITANPNVSLGKPLYVAGAIANPDNPANGVFKLKNVKITADKGTAIDNTAVEAKTTKIMRDGQMLIIRDGKTFNALGAEVK